MTLYLRKLIQYNNWFFTAFFLFLSIGGLLLLSTNPGDEIFFFSDKRSFLSNLFFRFFTDLGDGVAFVIATVLLLFWRFRTALVVLLLGLAVLVVSASTKRFFAAPRPYSYFKDTELFDKITFVEGVRVNRGPTSFPSGHTMTAFALYGFLALLLPNKRDLALLLFSTALLVGVSRMYLVQHFLSDVYLGAITGMMLAIIFHYLHNRYFKGAWAEKALLPRKKSLPCA